MNHIIKKMHIPKNILKTLKLRKESELKQEAADLEESRAISNTKRFKESLEVVDKVGKEIGEMREWAPYCSDPSTYMPFPIDIVKLTQQQMLQLLIHAYGTAQHLKDKLDVNNIEDVLTTYDEPAVSKTEDEADTNGWGVDPNETDLPKLL
jgi:hypothetical protein